MATLPSTVMLMKPHAKMGKPVAKAFQSLYKVLQEQDVHTNSCEPI